MVSAIPLCFLMLAVTSVVVSSQFISEEPEVFDAETPVAEKRTFKHKKSLKLLPLLKKHKKFGLLVPHTLGKTHYAEVPVVHEAPDRHIPETIIESSPSVHEYAPSFSYGHHFPSSPNFILFPVNERPAFSLPPPVFSSPAPPVYTPVPAPHFSYLPHSLPSIILPPALPAISIPGAAPPSLPTISIARPAPILPSIAPPHPTVITPVPSAPAFSSITVKIPSSPLPSSPVPILPSPTPAPIFSPVKLPISVDHLPTFQSVKFPISSTPLPSVSITPGPVLPSFSALPAPTPATVIAAPSPAPTLSISTTPEPEFPYPPSGSPIPSYIKDVSVPVTEPPTNSIVTPTYDQVHDFHPIVKPDYGFFHRLKDWKTDKATAAFSHFTHYKKPQVPIAVSTVPPPQVPAHHSLQIPVPIRPLPLAPDHRPPPLFFQPPFKYESFPPNNNPEAPPTLFNSYGAPIPHNSYAPPHDRLSSEASEQELSILPAPPSFAESQQGRIQHRQTEFLKEHPIYVPEKNENISATYNDELKEETKTEEGSQQTQQQQEEETLEDPNLQNHRLLQQQQ